MEVDYTVVIKGAKGFETIEFTDGSIDFAERMAEMGFEQTGVYNSERTRAEMQGQPQFKGLIGPMYDRAGAVRYEDQAAYDFFSM